MASSRQPTQEKYQQITHDNLRYRIENDPCFEESEITSKCQVDSLGDFDACKKEILNYKTCKDFWYKVKKDRLKKGIDPALPSLEERKEIKRQYLTLVKETVKKRQDYDRANNKS